MYDHLGTWKEDDGQTAYRLDLWDTGRTDSYGKSELHYALAIIPEGDSRPIIFDGEDFHPSPLTAIDSNESAAGLLSFFAAYGESIRFSGEDADVPTFTTRQREALAAEYEFLGMWSSDLDSTTNGA